MFNPQARWDRPQFNNETKHHAHKAIEVVAQFTPGKIKPLYFNLNNRRYEVERINYFWQDYRGREKLYCFNVTDGANIFQIYFSNQSLSWRLAKIE
jgi:hypothetical protein